MEGIIRYQTPNDLKFESAEFDNVIYEQGVHIYTHKSPSAHHYRIFAGVESSKPVIYKTFQSDYIAGIHSADEFRAACSRVELNIQIGIWLDLPAQKILIYRDPFGTVPVYYHHLPGEYFAFSSDLVRLKSLCAGFATLKINDLRIATYLKDDLTNLDDLTQNTFYQNLVSATPGYILDASKETIIKFPAVLLKPEKWAQETSIQEYGEILRAGLIRSVKSCTMNASSVSTHLSGGLDSSSMASIYRYINPDRDFQTLHIRANHKEADESHYASDVARSVKSHHHNYVQPTNDLELLIKSTELFGQPDTSFLSPAANVGSIAFLANQGADVLITGHGGDSVIGGGFEAPLAAFRQKDWKHLSEMLRKRVAYSSLEPEYPGWHSYSFAKKYNLVVQNFLYNQIHDLRRLPAGQLLIQLAELYRGMDMSFTYVARRASVNFLKRLFQEHIIVPNSIARKEFIHSIKSIHAGPSSAAVLRGELPVQYQELFEDVFHPHIIRGQEQHYALGNHYGISIQAPYMNLEVLEICMAVPDILKYGSGKGREHLREAMHGILHESVQNRSTKATLSSPDGFDMTYRLLSQSQDFLTTGNSVWDYVDRKSFDKQIAILNNNKIPHIQRSRSYFHITRTIALSVWLNSSR